MKPNPKKIIASAAKFFNCKPSDIAGPRRVLRFVYARKAVCLVLHRMGMTPTAIGKIIGIGSDAVRYNIRSAQDMIRVDFLEYKKVRSFVEMNPPKCKVSPPSSEAIIQNTRGADPSDRLPGVQG